MKKTRIKPISDKRQKQLAEEAQIKKVLCERAGGIYLWSGLSGVCVGGKCEICGNPPGWRGLHPHEKKFKSRGGKLSLKNSLMTCGKCHSAEHLIKEV